MNYWELTSPYFSQFKDDYDFFGTHTDIDAYGNEYTVKDDIAKATVHTMWHPLDDRTMIAEYGRSFDTVLYCIAYHAPRLAYGDRVTINGDEYEITSMRKYNTHTRIDVKKIVAG